MSSALPSALRKLRKEELLAVAEQQGLRGLGALRRSGSWTSCRSSRVASHSQDPPSARGRDARAVAS